MRNTEPRTGRPDSGGSSTGRSAQAGQHSQIPVLAQRHPFDEQQPISPASGRATVTQWKDQCHAPRNSGDLCSDARSRQGGRIRLPGDQRHVVDHRQCRPSRIRGSGQRRHPAGFHRRRRVRFRHCGEGHGHRRRRVGRVHQGRRRQVRHHGRAAHRPLPQGQAGHLRQAAHRDLDGARQGRRAAAVPVAHVGRLRRTARGEPGDCEGTA